jgi:hypothetical protein
MIQGRINSYRGLLPDWFYFQFTPHGRELQKYLDIVHGFTRKVGRRHYCDTNKNKVINGTL